MRNNNNNKHLLGRKQNLSTAIDRNDQSMSRLRMRSMGGATDLRILCLAQMSKVRKEKPPRK